MPIRPLSSPVLPRWDARLGRIEHLERQRLQFALKPPQHGKPAPQRFLFMAAIGGIGRQL